MRKIRERPPRYIDSGIEQCSRSVRHEDSRMRCIDSLCAKYAKNEGHDTPKNLALDSNRAQKERLEFLGQLRVQ